MIYEIKFPTPRIEKYFDKFLKKEVSRQSVRDNILDAVAELAQIPLPFDNPKSTQIRPPIPTHHHNAQYRLRIGNYRVLYNVDTKQKIVWILDIRLRSEKTYKR